MLIPSFGLLERKIKMNNLSEQLDMFYKGFELGRKFETETKEKEKDKAAPPVPNPTKEAMSWIPALVKYQTPPSWWKGGQRKIDMMGTIILVKACIESSFECSCESRDNKSFKWNWNIKDLLLWPTQDQVKLEQQRICLARGYK